jgi:photosystem II stability/assembly factor-like uncharacterized protein
MRSLAFVLLGIAPAGAAQWQPVTTDIIRSEKPGFGGLCGVVVDHATGLLIINLSDKGLYKSADQGKSWQLLKALKGRTEWPGCLMLDPGGGKKLLSAFVYGSPIAVSPDLGETWKVMDNKSSHVDWCAVDWADPDMKWVLTLKHESGDLLLASRDGGQSFQEVGKGYGPAWIFDKDTAVIAEAKAKTKPKPGILRTTDGGKTFERSADYYARALPRLHRGILYWVVEGAVISSGDQGKTWKKLSDLGDGRMGPVFGKTAQHQFVLTGSGIVESTDGGQTWAKPLPLPKEMKGASMLSWLEYDPVHDVVYVMKMGSELYKLERR